METYRSMAGQEGRVRIRTDIVERAEEALLIAKQKLEDEIKKGELGNGSNI